MDTDGHGLRDFIIRHASLTKVRSASRRVTLAKQESEQSSSGTRMATEFLKLKIKFQGKKTVSIRGHPCQKKKKYESNAEIGTGT